MEIIAALVPASLGFFEVKEGLVLADAAEFYQAGLGLGPEAFDAVEVLRAPGQFVFLAVDAIVLVGR
jgi:hypothetical protein